MPAFMQFKHQGRGQFVGLIAADCDLMSSSWRLSVEIRDGRLASVYYDARFTQVVVTGAVGYNLHNAQY